jgi:nuclear cap-binding protein subunit 1
MSSSAEGLEEKAREILEKTDIVASVQHPLENLAEPYPVTADERPFAYQSALELLQKQLLREAENGWHFSCIPRLYKKSAAIKDEEVNGENEDKDDPMNGVTTTATATVTSSKHAFPALKIPSPVHPGAKPMFPETYFSVYADQEIESVPRTDDISSSLIRDVTVDTINVLDFNRHAVAKFLITLDSFFAPNTFVTRATSFDRLKDIPEGSTTWKTEDMAIDAVFSQMLQLPGAEHKLVFYHSVITETCKLAPGAIAPTLGRAIRFLYRHIDYLDLELAYRFLDWFTHHLSNFDFRWKWTEWTDDIDAPLYHPKKAFIMGAIDKEIRLSFPKRIMDTLPREYHKLITEGKLKDQPEFIYRNAGMRVSIDYSNYMADPSPDVPYSYEGRTILSMLKKKVPETEIQEVIDAIQQQALARGVSNPLAVSTDVYMTSICFIGSKSLSHMLSCVERCKERLLAVGPQSDGARRQIIQSVVRYWKDMPGTAVNIVDKLLNYTIVTPLSVIEWCLTPGAASANTVLADTWRYEMVAVTMGKVTNRVRQIVAARVQADRANMAPEQLSILDETLVKERDSMRALFATIARLLGAHSESPDAQVRAWAHRWSEVFLRKAAVEETVASAESVQATLANARLEWQREDARTKREEEEREKRRAIWEERRRKEDEEKAKAEEAAAEAAREEALKKAAASNGDAAAPAEAEGGADQMLDVADDEI